MITESQNCEMSYQDHQNSESLKINLSSSLKNPIELQHYLDLPAGLYEETNPMPTTDPTLVEVNQPLLDQLGIDASWFHSEQGLSILGGNEVNDENQPIAMAYSGHQFGQWVPLLGDGRAHMLGQMAAADGTLIDVQLKGSGRTRFSRNGDGRATLGAVLREYVVSEAMAGLGIPTTRSIAILTTGDNVYRERIFPGAILVRTASSHLRVGSFQYAYVNLGEPGVKALADFVIANHFPELAEQPEKYQALLGAVIERQAPLIARWMLVGFIHGVMNTDNMSIVGETIDYGPCAFMDEFHPNKVFSSIDQIGRYAWDQQPTIAYWNLTQFARTLLPLLHTSPEDAEARAEAILAEFVPLFQNAFQGRMRQKLGLTAVTDEVSELINSTFVTLTNGSLDFTVFFDRLTRIAGGEKDSLLLELFENQQTGIDWLAQWRGLRSQSEDVQITMRNANPAVIARNHRVEQAIEAAVDHEDFEPFRRLCRAVANPFDLDSTDCELQTPPRPEERVTQTFCGT